MALCKPIVDASSLLHQGYITHKKICILIMAEMINGKGLLSAGVFKCGGNRAIWEIV